MAKIGLNNFRYGILTEAQDGTPSYDGAKTPAKAVSCSVNITNNSASLYADDTLAESDTSFQSGTVSIGIDDEDVITMGNLLGHAVVSGEMTRNADDVAPYVGFGRVVTKMVNGVYKYKVEFLYKVKFSEPNQEDATKGESLSFTTSTLEGMVSTLANGKWSVSKTFSTKANAIAYLESLLGGTISATVSVSVTASTMSSVEVSYCQASGTATSISIESEGTETLAIKRGTTYAVYSGADLSSTSTLVPEQSIGATYLFDANADGTIVFTAE